MSRGYISQMDAETLIACDRLLTRNLADCGSLSGGATLSWVEMLEEMQRRGMIELKGGSINDPTSALIQRTYESD